MFLIKENRVIDLHLFSQYLIAGLIMGVLYCLMSLGINFIYGIMKVINWAMGEYYMIGSYLLYLLVTFFLGVNYWFVAVLLAAIAVFFLGAFVQVLLIKPMFTGAIGERGEYGTIVTIATAIFIRNLAVVIGGPYIYTPPDYAGPTHIGPLPISGNTLVALIGALILLSLFYYLIKRTWVGRALQGVAQNRNGIQTSGVNILKFDMLAFGIGTALAAAAGALLAPVYLVYPTCGLVSSVRGFEIIVIAGLGSIWGVLVASLALGVVESLGAVFINPAFLDIYGFILLVIVLLIKPYGLFGKEERIA
jgi:branched-chain amino acid transport system permease protein